MNPHPAARDASFSAETGAAAEDDYFASSRLTREQALARMARQVDHESLPADGCIVLSNDAGMEDLRKKTADALRSLGLL